MINLTPDVHCLLNTVLSCCVCYSVCCWFCWFQRLQWIPVFHWSRSENIDVCSTRYTIWMYTILHLACYYN